MDNNRFQEHIEDPAGTLYQLQILDTPPEEAFDNIAALAACACDAPVAFIAFADNGRWWFKATHGLGFNDAPVHTAFSANLLAGSGSVVVEDTANNSFFSASPLLPADPAIRFFAAIPLSPEDALPGYLFVAGYGPRSLSAQQLSCLQMLARQATSLLQLRLHILQEAKAEEASEKLDKQKEFYENILNQLPTDIAVFDANHKYLFVNPGAIKDPELRKYIVGKDDYQYAAYRNRDISVAQGRRDQFLQVKNSGKEIRWEDNTVKDPDGNPITHLRRLFPVHNASGELTMVIGFGIDITDRKIMEEKQTALVKQLSNQNTQLIDFCNIVSHNLRAPLVNITMLVDFIRESKDAEEQAMLITKLKPVLDNLHTTFNELVESIQIKQDLEIKSEKNNLEHCLQRTLDGLKTEINKSGASIEYNFVKAPVIYCPSKYLFSIFHNLVSNSLKYQSPKRPPVIKLETQKQNGKIILSVSDNGLGIDLVKHKDNIFKIGKVFHRHPNAKGFGLFMTRTQVEAMDGKIWAESIPGEGSTFFIEFKNQK